MSETPLMFATAACLALVAGLAPADDLKDALFEAARKGDARAVQALLDKGADVNARNAYGTTALFFAADKGHREVVQLLIKHKADVNAADTFYKATPMTWAVMRNRADIVRDLAAAGAKTDG